MWGMCNTLCRYTTDINPNLASLQASCQQPQWKVFKHHHSGQWLINIINLGVDQHVITSAAFLFLPHGFPDYI